MPQHRLAVFDHETLRIHAPAADAVAGQPIGADEDAPAGTVFRCDDGFVSAMLILDGQGGSNIQITLDDGTRKIVPHAGPLATGAARVETAGLHHLRKLNEATGLAEGAIITVATLARATDKTAIWGFAVDHPLQDQARYLKIGGRAKGELDLRALAPWYKPPARAQQPDRASRFSLPGLEHSALVRRCRA